MQVDTSEFRAITDQVAAISAEVAELQRTMALSELSLDAIENSAYQRGRESVLGTRAEPRPSRPRHLRSVNGGAS
jgi:anti-sigma factor RsiW